MSTTRNETPPGPQLPLNARRALEAELDPERGRRTLSTGVVFFRIASLIWMIGFNLVSGGFERVWLAYLSFVAAAAWTLWLWRRPDDQDRTWALIFDLVLSTYIVLVSAFVVPAKGVISPKRLFFGTAYPLSTPLLWGMVKGLWGGLGSALVLSVALGLTRPLNGVHHLHFSEFVGVVNGAVYYLMAGGTIGAIAKSLERSTASVRRAVAVAMEAQERARWADTARDLHDNVLNGLGYVKRKLGELLSADETPAVAKAVEVEAHLLLHSELERLAGYTADQEQSLRDWISKGRRTTRKGYVNLGDRLKETRGKVPGISVVVNSVGPIQIPDHVAEELCAAVKEALQNVAKHAETEQAFVFADLEDDLLSVSVHDNGKGYDTSDSPPLDHRGRLGMRERAKALGGTVREVSAPGLGTTVEFRIPAEPRWKTSSTGARGDGEAERG